MLQPKGPPSQRRDSEGLIDSEIRAANLVMQNHAELVLPWLDAGRCADVVRHREEWRRINILLLHQRSIFLFEERFAIRADDAPVFGQVDFALRIGFQPQDAKAQPDALPRSEHGGG